MVLESVQGVEIKLCRTLIGDVQSLANCIENDSDRLAHIQMQGSNDVLLCLPQIDINMVT
jgi:hypothetical protein